MVAREQRWTERPPPDDEGACPPDAQGLGPDADPESVARAILLNALTGQARSRKELRDRLAKKDVPPELADALAAKDVPEGDAQARTDADAAAADADAEPLEIEG